MGLPAPHLIPNAQLLRRKVPIIAIELIHNE